MTDDALGAPAGRSAPPDAMEVPRFAGPDTFARLPRLDDADRIVALGGDHTIALPLLRALHRPRGSLALAHFDVPP